VKILKPRGAVAVITFHGLERIVKRFGRAAVAGLRGGGAGCADCGDPARRFCDGCSEGIAPGAAELRENPEAARGNAGYWRIGSGGLEPPESSEENENQQRCDGALK